MSKNKLFDFKKMSSEMKSPAFRTRKVFYRYLKTITGFIVISLIIFFGGFGGFTPDQKNSIAFIYISAALLLYIVFGMYSMISLRIRKVEEEVERLSE